MVNTPLKSRSRVDIRFVVAMALSEAELLDVATLRH
jgi:hypothetical protein